MTASVFISDLNFTAAPPLLLQEVGMDGRVRMVMEGTLTARDRVGVQDFVLLENFSSEAAFIENLRRRFKENLIYVKHTLTHTHTHTH